MKQTTQKVAIKGKGWNRSINIDVEKYETISSAILKVLTNEPVTYSVLVEKIKPHVKDFQGSVEWYTVSTLRKLENEKKVIRNRGSKTTYQKP